MKTNLALAALAAAIALAPGWALAHRGKGANGQVDFSAAGPTPTSKAHGTVSDTPAPAAAHESTGFDRSLPEQAGPGD